jgi:hypothetical protein
MHILLKRVRILPLQPAAFDDVIRSPHKGHNHRPSRARKNKGERTMRAWAAAVALVATMASTALSTSAAACTCAWFFDDDAASKPEVRAAANSAQIIVVGVMTGLSSDCGPEAPQPAILRMRVRQTLKGGKLDDRTIRVRVGQMVLGKDGCRHGEAGNSCAMHATVRSAGVFALRTVADDLYALEDVCTTDAVRLVVAKDNNLTMQQVGGEADDVNRMFGRNAAKDAWEAIKAHNRNKQRDAGSDSTEPDGDAPAPPP